MKKVTKGLMVCLLIFTLTGCGNNTISMDEYNELQSKYDLLYGNYDRLNTEYNNYKMNTDAQIEQLRNQINDTMSNSVESEVGESENSTVADEGIVVLKEYYYYSSHIIIVKNTTRKTVDISTSSLGYNSAGELIGTSTEKIVAVGAGCTALIDESFFMSREHVADTNTNITYKDTIFGESTMQNIEVTYDSINGGIIVYATNNGSEKADFVKVYALFLKGENLVDRDECYCTDQDYELKPGAMAFNELRTGEEYDTVEFYVSSQ